MTSWQVSDIPDLSGRRAIVTGGYSGVGRAVSRELARHGARVVCAGRGRDRGESAVRELRAELPDAEISWAHLDLADLRSVREFAAAQEEVDLLVANAGVGMRPHEHTADGFEIHLGTNYLGHFALTGLLLPRLRARVVMVGSGSHRGVRLDFADLQSDRSFRRFTAYGRSKLALMMFAFELNRRLDAAGATQRGVVADPGYTATNIAGHGPRLVGWIVNHTAKSAASGAAPVLFAATAPEITGGELVATRGRRGTPVVRRAEPHAYDRATASRLWTVSEELTGVPIEVAGGTAD